MEDKNWQQQWIERNPIIWKIIIKIANAILFLIKLEISLIILKMIGVV